MKNALLIAGVAAAGYGIWLFLKKGKKPDCGCSTTEPKLVSTGKEPLYSSKAVESYDYNWSTLFPTPARLGIKNNIELNEEFGQNLVSE